MGENVLFYKGLTGRFRWAYVLPYVLLAFAVGQWKCQNCSFLCSVQEHLRSDEADVQSDQSVESSYFKVGFLSERRISFYAILKIFLFQQGYLGVCVIESC